uniref:Uncharacterized protein n=1 Tax=Arundo donax TaxID=35708 RepID=A0A0A9AZ88_ARUDO
MPVFGAPSLPTEANEGAGTTYHRPNCRPTTWMESRPNDKGWSKDPGSIRSHSHAHLPYYGSRFSSVGY